MPQTALRAITTSIDASPDKCTSGIVAKVRPVETEALFDFLEKYTHGTARQSARFPHG